MTYTKIIVLPTLLLSVSCSHATADKQTDEKITPVKISANGVYSITLPELDPALPDKPGKEFVQNLCVTCHTTRYIMNQPELSREVWSAEITKMQKVFNAPVPAESVPVVLEYLMAVRGKESK